MGSARSNRLYNGKARMIHERQRAYEAFHQEEIDGYFDWAVRKSGDRAPLKIVVRGRAPTARAEPEPVPAAATAAPTPVEAPAAGQAVAPAPEQTCVARPDKPVRLLKPLPMIDGARFDRRFSYGKLACGFVLGTAAALAILALLDIAFL